MNNNAWANMMYNLGLMGGKWLGQAAQDRAVTEMDNLTADQLAQNIGSMGNYNTNNVTQKGNGMWQGIANRAIQNTPQNAGNVGAVTPRVQQTAPTVQGNAYAMPTTAQAVAGNGYNFATPTVQQLLNNLSGGYNGNFLMGRRY